MESRLTVRLDEEIKNKLDERAKKLKLTSAELVRLFISDGLLEHDKNHAQLVLLLSEILNKLEEVQWVLEEQSKKIEEKIEMVKKGNEGSLEKIETKISKVIMENEKQKGELEQYLKEMKEILENKKF